MEVKSLYIETLVSQLSSKFNVFVSMLAQYDLLDDTTVRLRNQLIVGSKIILLHLSHFTWEDVHLQCVARDCFSRFLFLPEILSGSSQPQHHYLFTTGWLNYELAALVSIEGKDPPHILP